jgi:hypothetical protein
MNKFQILDRAVTVGDSGDVLRLDARVYCLIKECDVDCRHCGPMQISLTAIAEIKTGCNTAWVVESRSYVIELRVYVSNQTPTHRNTGVYHSPSYPARKT